MSEYISSLLLYQLLFALGYSLIKSKLISRVKSDNEIDNCTKQLLQLIYFDHRFDAVRWPGVPGACPLDSLLILFWNLWLEWHTCTICLRKRILTSRDHGVQIAILVPFTGTQAFYGNGLLPDWSGHIIQLLSYAMPCRHAAHADMVKPFDCWSIWEESNQKYLCCQACLSIVK